MELRFRYERSGVELRDLQAALDQALQDEPEEAREDVRISAEEHDGLGTVTTVVAIWLVQRVAGKLVDKGLEALWNRVLDRVRARKGSDVLKAVDPSG